jgi:outer membrane protein
LEKVEMIMNSTMPNAARRVPWILLAVLLASPLLTATTARAADIKIAFVDLRRALNETNEGKAAMAKLTKHKDKLQKEIEKKEKDILQMKESIEKQQNVLTKEALQKKVEEYYQAVTELQQTYMQYQRELAQKETKATQDILVKLAEILEEIGQSEGYTMIYDRSVGAVVWAPSHLDLTDQLIQRYNAKFKSKKGK